MAKQEQIVAEKPPKGGVVASHAPLELVDAVPVEQTVDEIKQALGHNHIVCGDQHGYFDVAGESIASIRAQLADAYGIEADCQVYLDGKEITDESIILQTFQDLEFGKDLGDKG